MFTLPHLSLILNGQETSLLPSKFAHTRNLTRLFLFGLMTFNVQSSWNSLDSYLGFHPLAALWKHIVLNKASKVLWILWK